MLWSSVLVLIGSARAQLDYFDGAGVDASEENSVYLLMIIFFAINFITPVMKWINTKAAGAAPSSVKQVLVAMTSMNTERRI